MSRAGWKSEIDAVVATFASDHDLVHAIGVLRGEGVAVVDAFGPHAAHGIEASAGWRPSRLPWVAFVAGVVGMSLALRFQYWTSAEDWPIDVGGKPFDSLPAFVPVAFEVTVLFAALSLVAAFLIRSRLFPGSPRRALRGVTDDCFALELDIGGSSIDRARAAQLVARLGGRLLEDSES